MVFLKPCALVRTLRRKLRVELLEDRLQPGSVLWGVGFSLLGASLPEVDPGLDTSGADAAQMAHHRPVSEDVSVPFNLAVLTPVATGNGNTSGAATSPSPAPISSPQEISGSLAPPLTTNLAALSAPSVPVSSMPISTAQAGSVPVSTPVAAQAAPVTAQAAPVSQQPAAPPAVASSPSPTPPGIQHPVATATPLPVSAFHPLSARVVSTGPGSGQSGITPFASVNWSTYVTGTTGAGTGRGVTVDSSGNIYATGYTDDGTTKMAFVAEYTSTGSRIALTSFQAQDPSINYTQSEGHAIAVDNAGGVYVAGMATDAVGGDTDAFIMKFTFDATMNQFVPVAGYGGGVGGPFNDSAEGIAVDAAGEATITGTYGYSATETDMFAIKYDASGSSTMLFANIYQLPQTTGSAGRAITLDSTGANAYLAGSVIPTGGDNDILVMQIDNTSGDVVYSITMPNVGDDTLNGIAVDPMGRAYVAGTLAGAGVTDAYVAQISADGSSIAAQFVITLGQTGTGISLDPSGNVYVVGSGPDAAGNLHAFVEKLDPTLTPLDAVFVMGSGTETGFGIAYDPNSGNAYVVGTTTSTDLQPTDGSTLQGTSDAFLANLGNFP